MMNAADISILSIMILLPVAAAIFCLFARAEAARIIALTVTLFELLLGHLAMDQLRYCRATMAIYREPESIRSDRLEAGH